MRFHRGAAGPRHDLAEGGQINDTGSQKSILSRRGEGNRIGGMLVQFRGCRIDRRAKRRTISPRLGAFRDPLIAAITVIIDLLPGPSPSVHGIANSLQRRADASGTQLGTRELRRAADSASGGNWIWI